MTKNFRSVLSRAALVWILAAGGAAAQTPASTLPEAAGRDTVQRVCGACHPPTVVVGRGMTREEWGQVVASMISRGAKGTPAEFVTVTDYLTKNFPPQQAGAKPAAKRRGGGGGFTMGPDDKQVIDAEAAERGRAVYVADCAVCHGRMARGGPKGPDLVRSTVVLHDRYGSTLGPYLGGQHPRSDGTAIAALTAEQIQDMTHFLHQQVNNTLRSGPYTKVLNVLTGDAKAGAAYFKGAGGCGQCHSATGDLAGIASKYDPPTLQQRLLFPQTVVFGRGATGSTKPVTVKVTTPQGEAVTGTLVHLDDFNVSLRDGAGRYRSWTRTPELRVEKNDPYGGHDELLNKISDDDIHNLVAYLETLK